MPRLRRIVFATDLSDSSARAYSYAAELASQPGNELHIVHAVGPAGAAAPGPREAVGTPVPVRTGLADRPPLPRSPAPIEVELPGPDVRVAILDYASQQKADLIVMGARGQGGARKPAIGSVARYVVRHAPSSVLVVRDRMPHAGIRRVLVPVDFSETSSKNLRRAVELAQVWGAQLDLLHVVTPGRGEASFAIYPSTRPIPEIAAEWEARLAAFASESGVPEDLAVHVRVGPAAPTIINFALEQPPDLLVIGTCGEGSAPATVLGSVAESLSRCIVCPVLLLRPPLSAAQQPAHNRRVRRSASRSTATTPSSSESRAA